VHYSTYAPDADIVNKHGSIIMYVYFIFFCLYPITVNISIRSTPFIVGGRTLLTCFSPLEMFRVTSIAWINSGVILSSTTTQNELDLVFDPVTDDLALQGVELTCILIAGVTRTLSLQVVLLRKWFQYSKLSVQQDCHLTCIRTSKW
jgi:hypothetical protein